MKRLKRRYFRVQIETITMPSEREFIDAIWAAITKLYGDVGASSSGLSLISFGTDKQFSIFRVWLSAVPMVRSSIATITAIAGRDASIHVLAVSGTIKSLWDKENDT